MLIQKETITIVSFLFSENYFNFSLLEINR